MAASNANGPSEASDPLWFKDAVVYQLHVRSFSDSTGDGIGDFRGLAERLDYIRDLGVTAIWLLPFYPSPLRDDGYDIADYTSVNPSYGTLSDFKNFLREAHLRGLRVITELVVNHTSDQHPWFQRARRAAPGSAARNFYVWSDTPEKYKDARIIFKDFETSNWSWDPVANAYYWHRFYSHQPDLNFENPEVRQALQEVMDFWLALGVDGFRLDAVPYLHEREGTTCENLVETHAELKALRAHIDTKYGDRMLLAEANQWPEDAAAYFGQGDECHMAFHFPLMPRMFMALRMEDRHPIIDILSQTPNIPESCQWAVFLRNHDELTLEMVTDEERDYMYRMYAKDPQARINLGIRRRLAPLLGNDRRRIELMNGLLLSLPGTPVLYYGDEIGLGDNIYLGDRNGVRTPMQWSADRNAGFSRANSQKLFLPVVIDPGFNYEALNVESQQDNVHSLLWWMRRVIGLRQRYQAFGRGSFEFLHPSNRKILAYVRRFQQEQILVIANLSRFTQYAELDLQQWKGLVPIEAFGHTRFPQIGDAPYLITLGPHSFFWFVLQSPELELGALQGDAEPPPTFRVEGRWQNLFEGPGKASFEQLLLRQLPKQRWFGGKSRPLKGVEVFDTIPLGDTDEAGCLLLARVEYVEGDPEVYQLTLALGTGARMEELQRSQPNVALARLLLGDSVGVLYSGARDRAFCSELLEIILRRRQLESDHGALTGVAESALRPLEDRESLEPSLLGAEQSNTSIVFGKRAVLKLFRKLEDGLNPDVELGTFLTQQAHFEHTPPVLGYLEYRPTDGEPLTLGVLQGYVPNDGDAWQFTLDHVSQYFDRVKIQLETGASVSPSTRTVLELAEGPIPQSSTELVGGPYLEAARLLGQRTAELHLALVSGTEPALASEPFTLFHQRSLLQSFRNLTEDVFDRLQARRRHLPEALQERVGHVLLQKQAMFEIYRSITAQSISARRSRIHGDYHLGQVLWTGRDFMIIDFEGEPRRSISARRIKRCPLLDAAGMVRSLHYAVHHGLRTLAEKGLVAKTAASGLESYAEHWFEWSASAFLRSYLRVARTSNFLPQAPAELEGLFAIFLLEKAIYELGYELDHRPDWVDLPLKGIESVLTRRAKR